MARQANNTPFLEEWLRGNSGSTVGTAVGHQTSTSSAREIIQAWAELRDSLQNQKFDHRHLQALKTLISSEATLHVADPQAKLLISILSNGNIQLPPEPYPLFLRLLYIWIRKSFRPSLQLVDLAVQVLSHAFYSKSNFSPYLIAQGILVFGAFTCVLSLSDNSKSVCLELLCRILEEEYPMIRLQEELVPEILAGIGYALSSSLNVYYVRLLDSLFGIWEKENGPRASVAHGLMILHLVEWVVSGFIKSKFGEKIIVFVKEVLETSKENYARFAVLMAAAGALRSLSRSVTGIPGSDAVSRIRSAAENRIGSVAQNLIFDIRSSFCDSERHSAEALLLKCFSLALARSGPVTSSGPLLLCLASALLTEVYPLGHIYKTVHGLPDGVSYGQRLIWVKEYLSGILFKEAGAITGALCNQYISANEENKGLVENLVWDFCQNLYLRHRQAALLLRGVEDELLRDIEKIAESSFLFVVVFALAVTRQRLNSAAPKERQMETSVNILVSFSCVEYFRSMHLPEYMDTIRGVIVSVQENDYACVSFVESMPNYDDLTNPKDSFIQSSKYAWSLDEVQTARILFYMRVMPTCIGRLPASVFRRVATPTMFLYMGHPNGKVARASHSLFVAFVSSAKDSEEDERVQLKEHLVFYYMQRSVEGYPGITPFEGMASGVASLVRHLPAGSPAIFYSVDSLVKKASRLCQEAQTLKSDAWKTGPCKEILELLLRLVSLVDVQVLPNLMKSLAQLIIQLPKDARNMVLDELYGQVSESDDVIRKPALVSWLQSLNYICSQADIKDVKSKAGAKQENTSAGGTADAWHRLDSRL